MLCERCTTILLYVNHASRGIAGSLGHARTKPRNVLEPASEEPPEANPFNCRNLVDCEVDLRICVRIRRWILGVWLADLLARVFLSEWRIFAA